MIELGLNLELQSVNDGVMRMCSEGARCSDNVYNVYLRKRSSDNISTFSPASAPAREAAPAIVKALPTAAGKNMTSPLNINT